MEGGLHGNSGGYGGAGEGEGGTGGYVELIEEYLHGTRPSLQEIYNKELTEVQIQTIEAETQLEKSKTEFLKAQVGLTDPAKIELSRLMSPQALASQTADYGTLLIIAGVVWYFYKGGKL